MGCEGLRLHRDWWKSLWVFCWTVYNNYKVFFTFMTLFPHYFSLGFYWLPVWIKKKIKGPVCKVWLHLMVRKCIANDVKDVFFIPFYSNWPLVIVIHWLLKWRTKLVFVTAVNLNPADEMCPQRAEGPSVPAGQTLAETFQGAVWGGAENRAGLQPLLHRLVVVFVWGPQNLLTCSG